MSELEQVIDPIVNSGVLEQLKNVKFSTKDQRDGFINKKINQDLNSIDYNIYNVAEEMAENENLYKIDWTELPSNIEGCIKTIVHTGLKNKIKNKVLYFKGEI
jgi:hypothetical protein